MANDEEELERQFLADLEKAKALSLEALELEKLRTEQRKKSIIEACGWRNRPTASVTPLPPLSTPLPPPPSTSGRKLSTQTATTDLMSFHSPTKPEDSKTFSDLDQFLTNPLNNQPSLLPYPSTLKTDTPPDYGFKADVLLRHNPFPQPAPFLNSSPQPGQFFNNSQVPYPKSSPQTMGNYSFGSSNYSLSSYNLGFAGNFPQNNTIFPNSNGQVNLPYSHSNPQMSYQPLQASTPNKQHYPPFSNPFPAHPPQAKPASYHSPSSTPPNSQTPLYATPVPRSQLESPSFPSMQPLMKSISKKEDTNLIDLTPERPFADSSTVLEAFDPLVTPIKDDGSSIYGSYDPFDYMAGGSQGDSLYAEVEPTVAEEEEVTAKNRLTADWIRTGGLVFDSNRVVQTQLNSSGKETKTTLERVPPWFGNPQLEAFCTLVTDLRVTFSADNLVTNPGLVLAPTVECHLKDRGNVKLVVSNTLSPSNVTFACDLCTSIEHVISHVVCELEAELGGASPADFVLKVDGTFEYMAGESTLGDYEYIYQCIKMDRDVTLVLVPAGTLKRPLARTTQDDVADVPLLPQHLLPSHVHQHPISFETLSILLETVDHEIKRLTDTACQQNTTHRVSCKGVEQAVKALCSLMGQLETIEISSALDELRRAFEASPRSVTVVDDRGPYSTLLSQVTVDHTVSKCCGAVKEAVLSLIQSYCGAFNVDFRLSGSSASNNKERTTTIESVSDPLLVYVGALHRPSINWRFPSYLVEAQVFHGTRAIRAPHRSSPRPSTKSFYERVEFKTWISLDDIPLGMLPREARVVFALFGLQPLSPDHELSKLHPGVQQYEKIELGWAAVQCFDQDGLLTEGHILLSVWPVAADKRMGPAPEPGTHPLPHHSVLELALPLYTPRPKFIPPTGHQPLGDCPDLGSLDPNTQQLLLDVTREDSFSSALPEEREILWEKRHYLVKIPEALPKVLLAATAWDIRSLPDLHSLLRTWARMSPLAALQLLLPCFPDMEVRALAIACLHGLNPDELVDYLPQLVQALKHETYEVNPLAKYLLEQALTSPRVAHHLFWLLVQILPGDNPQNSVAVEDTMLDNDECVAEYRYHWRLRVLLRALLAVAGGAMRLRLCSQLNLVKALYDAAQRVKLSKESIRVRSLLAELEMLHHVLQDEPSGLPLNSSITVNGIQVRTCSYFASKTLPLKIDFLSEEGRLVPAIFKVGDDLRQDALTLQMIRVMDKLWLKEGLDLRMVTFDCVPTGHMRGMIQMITEAETLRIIQTEHGLTGSFKDRPIAEWLAKHNPGALEYARAVTNFTASCAGYSVATYVLGICDRHNDNIMLNTSGHLFHIDFGKFLGDAQMFGNFKRDRAPFVLTSDMAYVINGGDRPTQSFQQFVDLCCQAFAVVRQNSNVILNLLGFMVGAGIPGVTLDSMRYVQRALLPGVSRAEASATFSRLIESALSSWFTQFNFFLHNLSQLRTGGDRDGGCDLLSFVPKRHTCEEDGRIIGTEVHNVQKRYGTEKHYVYVIRVERENSHHSYIFRTYREFCELHSKICALFPLAKVYSLQEGIQIGRSAVKHVAFKRKIVIEKFLVSLFSMADELSHSDIVYTFFHPLLRDQEDVNINQDKVKDNKTQDGPSHTLSGQLKLTLMYQRNTLTVMVAHARGLAKVANGQEPSTYVKVYLLPDPSKCTKRKTKVVKRNCHPTFMEMLEYRELQLDLVRSRVLQATVWSHDPLQENEFLGGVEYPLHDMAQGTEVTEWFPLGLVPR